jgi:hypothetical protein
MMHKQLGRRELFTVSEANAMLPLVRAIVGDLASLSNEVIDRRRRLTFLMAGRDPDDRDVYHQELVQVEEDLEKDKRQLREYVEELRSLGVELTSGPEGVVSFPSTLDGMRVSLSWKLGEPEVLHWHPYGSNHENRRLLTADVLGE